MRLDLSFQYVGLPPSPEPSQGKNKNCYATLQIDRYFIKITLAARGLNCDNFYKCKTIINLYYNLYNDNFRKLIDKNLTIKKVIVM